jgi:hypothetical protein
MVGTGRRTIAWPRPPIRIAVLTFVHETVTFLQSDTTIDDYIHAGSPLAARRSPARRF